MATANLTAADSAYTANAVAITKSDISAEIASKLSAEIAFDASVAVAQTAAKLSTQLLDITV